MNKLDPMIEKLEAVNHPQTYGIREAQLYTGTAGARLEGAVYGHPLYRDGDKQVIMSAKITHWVVGSDEYYETAEGVTYRTFDLPEIKEKEK